MAAEWNRPSPADAEAIRSALPQITKSLAPAQPRAIAKWVEYLLNRYPRKAEVHPEFSEMDKRMWVNIIGHWPEDVLEAAVTQWCNEERPFPPRVPGELKALGEPIVVARRQLEAAAVRVLGLPAAPVYVEKGMMTKLLDAMKRGITNEVASVLKQEARAAERSRSA